MITNGVSVVQVNPYAVKQTKELEDNSQLKDDRKDPKLIANLVKDGNYGMPYLPEDTYAELRRLSMLRDQLTEDRIRNINRLHRELKICFPEYMDAFGKLDGAFTLMVLKKAPFPEDILALGTEGLREIWHEAKLRGRGYSRADQIVRLASESVGLKYGTSGSREAVRCFVEQILYLTGKLDEIEVSLHQKCREIPYAENLLEIGGVGENILAGILAEMGDVSRFDDVKEIQKLSGLGLVACSSGKHKGETKISHRGRKRLRYWLFQAARSAVSHAEEFKTLHMYYTMRPDNPLKKMQSLIVIACKILRVIFAILRTGQKYDPAKMLRDIKHPAVVAA
jgi:transposase